MTSEKEPDFYYLQPGHPLSPLADRGGRFKVNSNEYVKLMTRYLNELKYFLFRIVNTLTNGLLRWNLKKKILKFLNNQGSEDHLSYGSSHLLSVCSLGCFSRYWCEGLRILDQGLNNYVNKS
jgi:hypothetical protein